MAEKYNRSLYIRHAIYTLFKPVFIISETKKAGIFYKDDIKSGKEILKVLSNNLSIKVATSTGELSQGLKRTDAIPTDQAISYQIYQNSIKNNSGS